MKLVHGLVFSIIDLCNTLYYGLPNIILIGLQFLINSAAGIAVGLPRFSRERIPPICIDLHILPIKAGVKCKNFLLTHKAMQCKKPLYLKEMFENREPSTINLRSNHDTWKLLENRTAVKHFAKNSSPIRKYLNLKENTENIDIQRNFRLRN